MQISTKLFSLSRPLNASELLKTIRSDPGMTAVYYANRYFGSDKVMQVNHILWGQLKRFGKVYHEHNDGLAGQPQWFPVFGMARIHRVQRHNPEEEDLSVLNANNCHLRTSVHPDLSRSSVPGKRSDDCNKEINEGEENFPELEALIVEEVAKQPGNDIQYYIQFLPEHMQRVAPLVFRRLRESGRIRREFTSGGTFVWR